MKFRTTTKCFNQIWINMCQCVDHEHEADPKMWTLHVKIGIHRYWDYNRVLNQERSKTEELLKYWFILLTLNAKNEKGKTFLCLLSYSSFKNGKIETEVLWNIIEQWWKEHPFTSKPLTKIFLPTLFNKLSALNASYKNEANSPGLSCCCLWNSVKADGNS